MLFESLTERLSATFKKLRGKGKLSEADVKEAMREVRLVLLGADVNIKVVKAFVAKVTDRACGAEVLESLTPAQQVVKIVHEELVELMGGQNAKLVISSTPPTVVMMAGLQGSGKTTSTAKLAGLYKRQGKRPLLAACDVYRPAAVKQLQVVGEGVGVPVYAEEGSTDVVAIAKNAVAHARRHGNDMVFLDTAGRLHIDEELMAELEAVKAAVSPGEILLVVDAMTGQDAVNVAEAFEARLGITGVVMSKMDGDARGGAALSVRYVTGKPIKFVGTGEKLTEIEAFHPDRIASRILGMGDVLTLIEKAQENLDVKKAEELERKMRAQKLDLSDFLDQMRQLKSMGGMEQMLSMMPGVNAGALKDGAVDEREFAKAEAIICAMTPKERANPEILSSSRKRRVAAGSGTGVEDVNKLLRQFDMMKKLMKQLGGVPGKRKKGFGGMRLPF
ncbi:MAG TPA: signal recognition particle protein [Candidatus Acidoferrum sp.]|nr:signal recognition particle protein [Candidatus Acidoferrum sp.]